MKKSLIKKFSIRASCGGQGCSTHEEILPYGGTKRRSRRFSLPGGTGRKSKKVAA